MSNLRLGGLEAAVTSEATKIAVRVIKKILLDIQRSAKKQANLAKQDPGRARQNS